MLVGFQRLRYVQSRMKTFQCGVCRTFEREILFITHYISWAKKLDWDTFYRRDVKGRLWSEDTKLKGSVGKYERAQTR